MEIKTQNIEVYKRTTIIRRKVKLDLLKGIVKNIPSRSPLFEGVESKRTLLERERE